jgi:hypothetical protein
MNMKVLDQLISETIMEPATISSMENGAFSKIVDSSNFDEDLKTKLKSIGCEDFNKFVAEAYELITTHDAPEFRIRLPSAAEGIELHSKPKLAEAVA